MKQRNNLDTNKWEIEIFCTGTKNRNNGCNNRLLVSKNDIFIQSESKRSLLPFTYMTICPLCGKITRIPEEKLPYQIRKELIYKYLGIWITLEKVPIKLKNQPKI